MNRILAIPVAGRVVQILSLLTFPVGCGIASIAIGQDLSVDTLNYHLYNAWAFLNAQDLAGVFPAGAQSLINPIEDVPFYLLRMDTPPLFAAFVTGFWQGLAPLLTYLIAKRLTRSRFISLLAGVTAAISGGFASELGTSIGDDTVAVFFLLAIFMGVIAIDRRHEERSGSLLSAPVPRVHGPHSQPRTRRVRGSTWYFILAGFFAGLGAGVKLAEISMAVGIVLAVLFIRDGYLWRVRLFVLTVVASILGFLASGGYWSYFLWRHFGDPLAFTDGPLLFFKSPYYPGAPSGSQFQAPNFSRLAYFPIQVFFHPLDAAEIPIREASLPIAWVLFLALIVLAIVNFGVRAIRLGMRTSALEAAPSGDNRTVLAVERDMDRYVIAAFVIMVIGWIRVFAVYRYVIPAEVLAPVAIIACGRRIAATVRSFWPKVHEHRLALATLFAALCGLCIATESPSNYWVRVPFAGKEFQVGTPEMLANSKLNLLVELSSPNPEGFVLTLLHSHFAAVGSFGWDLNPASAKLLRSAFRRVESSGGNVVGFWTGESLESREHWAQVISTLANTPYRTARCVTETISLGTFAEPIGFCRYIKIHPTAKSAPTATSS